MTKAWQQDINNAVEVLRKGGVILYPTDTVWGIGCDATNEEAVRKVYEIKRREDNKAMLVLVDSENRIQRYISQVPNVAWDVIELATNPLTVIFNGAKNLPANLVGEDGTLGIRVTREPFSQQLCYRFSRPIVSTSANFSGEPSARCFDEISEELKGMVDYVCTSRRNEQNGKPSSIIKLGPSGEVEVIRK
ncbi:MAG: threonylcarbamoyl-AMP synthase [Bacteroidaceae bacterium]|nr:threonylcarbamoyl-AMP synthase [Bacteroidaceae bacterium]MCF0186672.1 threonylcarbamoyl-AMP synthase [Bacteroidaceae bacterium]